MVRLLEVAANSLESALQARQGGADRVELCENLGEGGTTPSFGTIALAREYLDIALHVLIRPRAGDFVYTPREWEAMRCDVELCAKLGCDGVVIGGLTASAEIDMDDCRMLMDAAAGMQVTFHRAYDCVSDRTSALEHIIALGCSRVLTSGGADGAPQGAAAIAHDVTRAAGRLIILPGAGISPETVGPLVRTTGVQEVHASCKALVQGQGGIGPAGLDRDFWQTDASRVQALRLALDAAI